MIREVCLRTWKRDHTTNLLRMDHAIRDIRSAWVKRRDPTQPMRSYQWVQCRLREGSVVETPLAYYALPGVYIAPGEKT